MSYDPRAEILWSGTDDWVSLAEAAAIVADERDVRDASVRDETLAILEDLIRADLIVPGEIGDAFRPWGVGPEEAMQRITTHWKDPSTRPSLVDGTWFANTPAGDTLAHELAEAGLTTSPDHPSE